MVALSGQPSPLLAKGELDAPGVLPGVLRAVERIAKRHGAVLPVMGAGGVFTPEDAVRVLDAGATLVELYAGFVYAGPGLPARILAASRARGRNDTRPADSVEADRPSDSAEPHKPSDSAAPDKPSGSAGPDKPSDSADRDRTADSRAAGEEGAGLAVTGEEAARGRFADLGPYLVGFTGIVLIGSGIFALLLAGTVKLLPYDVEFLGMTMNDLCERNACRIVHFMAHDRVSFGGSIISVGSIYAWLGAVPLRRGEAWAWWAALLSGIIGFASFLTYLGYGYLDVWHGGATLALLPVYLTGMALSFRGLKGARGFSVFRKPGARAWLYSPAGLGRLAMTFTAFGMISGGLIIMMVGMTRVFVPQDLEYMGTTIAELRSINPRLIPLIAHDRAGFGGGLCSTGLAVMASVWYGARPGAAALWRTLLLAGLVGFSTAIGVHPIVGYTSFVHLAPAYAGALAFLVGMALLYKPMCRTDGESRRFSDL
ncbi:MAG: hypothetical protein R3B70_30000 [Polyangiaceae bacterium]